MPPVVLPAWHAAAMLGGATPEAAEAPRVEMAVELIAPGDDEERELEDEAYGGGGGGGSSSSGGGGSNGGGGGRGGGGCASGGVRIDVAALRSAAEEYEPFPLIEVHPVGAGARACDAPVAAARVLGTKRQLAADEAARLKALREQCPGYFGAARALHAAHRRHKPVVGTPKARLKHFKVRFPRGAQGSYAAFASSAVV